jgi:hypothetical protein
LTTAAHRSADELHEVNRAGDVRVDHMTGVVEVLVEKGVSQPVSGIGQQRINGPARCRGPQLIHAGGRGQIGLHDLYGCAKLATAIGRGLDFRPIRSNQQIKSFLGANRRQFESNARRRASHNCEWFAHLSPSSGISTGSART